MNDGTSQEETKKRSISLSRVEKIRNHLDISSCDLFSQISEFCSEQSNTNMSVGELLTAWGSKYSFKATAAGAPDQAERDFMTSHFESIDMGGEVSNIRYNKEKEQYSVICQLEGGEKQSFFARFEGVDMTWGVQKITLGVCTNWKASETDEDPGTDTVVGSGEEEGSSDELVTTDSDLDLA